MYDNMLRVIIICLMSCLSAGCIVGYKTFSVVEKQPPQPATNLENIKILCTAEENDLRSCDSIQYALRTKYHILDVQAIRTAGADRLSIHVKRRDEKSIVSGIWSVISGLSFAVIPAVLSEDRIYQFKVTTPGGESRAYDYQFVERTFSWLPLLLFAPGYYEDMSGMSMDKYARKRDGILEESIIPRLMQDAEPFVLSAGIMQDKKLADSKTISHKYSYTLISRHSGMEQLRHIHPTGNATATVVQKAIHDSFSYHGISDVIKSQKLEMDRINIVAYSGSEPDLIEIHIINPALEHEKQLRIIKTDFSAMHLSKDKAPDDAYYQTLRTDMIEKAEQANYLGWRRVFDRILAELERN